MNVHSFWVGGKKKAHRAIAVGFVGFDRVLVC